MVPAHHPAQSCSLWRIRLRSPWMTRSITAGTSHAAEKRRPSFSERWPFAEPASRAVVSACGRRRETGGYIDEVKEGQTTKPVAGPEPKFGCAMRKDKGQGNIPPPFHDQVELATPVPSMILQRESCTGEG